MELRLGRLRLRVQLTRTDELRWQGANAQWVISPVQVALWTGMRDPARPYRWLVNRCPFPRLADQPEHPAPDPA